mgnify:FL=1|jgi:transketolase|tara:strand:- start:15005 stop:15874 length:870 start_codon:yes stop_codon:yes gene_type:complete
MRKEFANICSKLIKDDPSSVVLIGDISHYLLKETEEYDPKRFYNVGICEQSIIGMASGLALEGMRPIVHTIAPFIVERAYEQIKVDLGYQKTDVTLISVGGSYDYSDLGCTHHCYGDVALMRLIPNMEVYEPGNPKEFYELFNQTWGNGNPKYFRLSSHSHNQQLKVIPGEINLVRESKDGRYVFVCGHFLDDVLEDKNIGVFYVPTLSHISKQSIQDVTNIIKDCDTLYTVENHFKIGGLGDLISQTFDKNIKHIGIDRKFLTSYGSYDDLRKEAGLDKKSILLKLKA